MSGDRAALLVQEADAWAALLAASEAVPDDRRTVPGAVPGWSVTDLVYHCGKCAELTGTRLEATAEGTSLDEEPSPAEVQAENDRWTAESKTLSWEQAIAISEAGRMKARTALEALPEMDDAAAGWFREETVEHYTEHTEEISRFAAGG